MKFNVEFKNGTHYEVSTDDIKASDCAVLNKRNIATFSRVNYNNFEENGLYVEIWESICQPQFGDSQAKISEIELREGQTSKVIEPISHAVAKVCVVDKRDVENVLEIEENNKLIITRFTLEDGSTKLLNLRVAQQQCKQITGDNVTPSLYETIFNLSTYYTQKYGMSLEEIAGSIDIDLPILQSIMTQYEHKNTISNEPTEMLKDEQTLIEEDKNIDDEEEIDEDEQDNYLQEYRTFEY